MAFSPDGDRIASGAMDKTVRIWDAQTGAELAVLRGHEGTAWYHGNVNSVAFSTDGDRIVSGAYGKNVRVWNVQSGESMEVIQGAADVRAIAAGPSQFPLWVIQRDMGTTIAQAGDGQHIVWLATGSAEIATSAPKPGMMFSYPLKTSRDTWRWQL